MHLTSVWLVSLHPKSFYHDVHPRKDATRAQESDPSPGWPRRPPLSSVCPSPSKPTAAETVPAMHSLPWLTGFNSSFHNFTARQVDKCHQCCWRWLPLHLSTKVSLFTVFYNELKIPLFSFPRQIPGLFRIILDWMDFQSIFTPKKKQNVSHWNRLQEPATCRLYYSAVLCLSAFSLCLSLSASLYVPLLTQNGHNFNLLNLTQQYHQ